MIVAASSWREAAKLTGCSFGYIREYWGIAGNSTEIQIAMANPRVVYYREDHDEFFRREDSK